MERRLVEAIMKTVENSERDRVESIARSERELRRKREAEFQKYKANKMKVECIHKPRDLLQKTGPYKPLRNILLYYFKCEEGLRALLSLPKKPKPVTIKFHEDGDRVRVELLTETMEETTPKPPDFERPVKVRIQGNSVDESLLVQFLSENITMDEIQAKLEEATRRKHERPVKIRMEESNRTIVVELLSESISLEDVQTELERLPVKARIQEKSVKVDVVAENILMDDIVRTRGTTSHETKISQQQKQQQQVPCEKESRVEGPVEVKFREVGSALKLELVPNPNYVEAPKPDEIPAGKSSTAKAPRSKHYDKKDWIPDYPRVKFYEKEDWIPREEEGLAFMEHQSILCSTKVVWYPNNKSLERRDAAVTTLQTSSMNLLKKLRPSVDRPQFKVSPEVVNFRKVKLGATAVQIVTLSNYQSDFSRFKIYSEDDCLKVVYDHGPLASGMTRRLKVYLKGSTRGQFSGKLHIETEFDIFFVPVLAEVLQI